MSLIDANDIMTDDLASTIVWTGVGNVSAVVQEQAEQGDQGSGGRQFRPTLGKYVTLWVDMDDVTPQQNDSFTARGTSYLVKQITPVYEANMWELFASANVTRNNG